MQEVILVVDDSKLARKIAIRALKNRGFDNIAEAATAAEARTVFQETQPDLTLLDITLPDNYDLTLLQALLELKADARIIMVSAIGQELIIQDAKRLGAKGFLTKPYEEDELLETVYRVLEQK